MTEVTGGEARAATRTDERPGSWALALRPAGYLLVGTVWTAIWLAAVLLLVGSVPFLALVDSETLVSGVGQRLSNPLEAIGLLVIAVPILALAIGPGSWHVLTASWPLAVLSFTYLTRALKPSYAREKLSFTSRASWGSTFGPPTVTGVALSLQPVRRSRFTDAVMRFYVAGWTVDGRMVLAMLPAGLAWPCAIAALIPTLSGTVRLVAAVLTVVLLAMSCVRGVRAFRNRFAAPAGAAAERGIAGMTAAERARRLEELRALRDRRARGGRADR